MPFGNVEDEETCYKWKWIEGTAYAVLTDVSTPDDFGEPWVPRRVPHPDDPNADSVDESDQNRYQEHWTICVGGTYYEQCTCEELPPAPEGDQLNVWSAAYQPGPCGRSKKDRENADSCKCKSSFLLNGGSRTSYPRTGYKIDFCCEISAEQTHRCDDENAFGHPSEGREEITPRPCMCLKAMALPSTTLDHDVERGDSLFGLEVGDNVGYSDQAPRNTQNSRDAMMCALKQDLLTTLEILHGPVANIKLCGECEEATSGDVPYDADSPPGEGLNKDRCEGYPKGEFDITGGPLF